VIGALIVACAGLVGQSPGIPAGSAKLEVEVAGKRLRYVESNRLARKRVESLFAKEPTTIPWLEAIGPEETLVDIGANVGMYTVYAAVVAGCRVLSFEPEALNYAELNKNIFVNGLHERVTAYCLAMSDEEKVSHLLLGAFGYAYSHHDFDENSWREDKKFGDKATRREARLRQGSVSATLDELVARGAIPFPDHVKIDVDGLEYKVVAGARKTFADPRLKSVLIEVNFADDRNTAIIDEMTSVGWRWSLDQLRTNRKAVLSPETIEKIRAEKWGGFNYIFFRDERYAKLFADFLAHYEPPWAKKVTPRGSSSRS
jgi:FkbM family methyltransferase